MEYDRALYRVYEHIMEDLNASTAPTTNFDNNSFTPRRRITASTTTANNNSTTLPFSPTTTTQSLQTISSGRNGSLLPLFLPACMAPVLDILVSIDRPRDLLTHDVWNRISRVIMPFSSSSSSQGVVEEENGQITRLSGNRGGNAGGWFMRQNNRHVRLSTSPVEEDTFVVNGDSDGNESNELRRSISSDDNENYDGTNNSTSASLEASSSSSSEYTTEEEETTVDSNLPHSASMAQNVARAQLRRHRRRHDAENTAAEEEGNDDESIRSQSTTEEIQERRNITTTTTEGCTQKLLYRLMHLSLLLGIFHLFVLLCLHSTYVGAGVVPPNNSLFSGKVLEETQKTCLEYALETRGKEERSSYYDLFGDDDSSSSSEDEVEEKDNEKEQPQNNENDKKKDDKENDEKEEEEGPPPLVGKDEIVQIRILYGGTCEGQCSRVQTVVSNNQTVANNDNKAGKEDDWSYENAGLSHYLSKNESFTHNPLETQAYWKKPDYRFSTSEALLYLDSNILWMHNVTVVNVTLTERCLSSGNDQSSSSIFTKASEIFSQVYGMDSAVINQFMYGIKTSSGRYRNGHLKNMKTKERWSWRKDLLEPTWKEEGSFFTYWCLSKIGNLALAILSFFLIMSVTALIVRVLTTSGVVIMFPLFACFRACGLPGADDRILNLSYSWIGRARNAIDRRGIHTSWHLIAAHMAKIFLYYAMYEACQAAWSVVLYTKSVPVSMPIWIYAFAMIWEYFSMVFVRSVLR
uniref:Uncharacterized protein n=1 Tax=Ditylum brightwellii TaxID=49249 RepID=A0A7S4VIQ3_9STRA